MPYIDVDIDVDDFYDNCSSYEKKELISYLREDGLLPDAEEKMVVGNTAEVIRNVHDVEWYELLQKLAPLRMQMSVEDIEAIKQIVKKY